ncbi:Actin-related protein 6 [Paramarasmius palmivorus]|uniref:Actin-like protein ARP6 n=1 Tax=Paramarasmius palmivorus TaxID=297713 RepID=A0AAW0DU27_9AGAR
MKNSTVVVLDNGGHTIKTGVVKGKDKSAPPRLVPNAIIRSKGDKTTYFGHELEDCKDYSSLHYRLPLEKGYIIDWDAQKAIWDGVFSDKVLGIDTTASSLVLTEPYFNLPNIQEVYDQFIFEEYEFSSYYRCTPASLIPHGKLFSVTGLPPPECMIIVDSGFSFTHVVPILSGNIVWDAVKRLDVGGKLLTNHLKELVSFRQWNMMEETYIMNDVKERCCYVSQDFKQDLEITRRNSAKNEIVQQYVLPDLTVNKHGHIRQPDDIPAESDQILLMNNERFSVPELIFRPDDIGLEQCGLADTIAASISLLPVDLQGMFWANIGLIGGNTRFPGFRQRLLTEVQSHVPSGYEVVIYECDDPVTEAYKSALGLATSPSLLSKLSVTRSEYQESGSNASWRKFRDWRTAGATTTSESDPSMDPESAKAQKDDRAVAQERQGASTSKTSRTRSSGKTGIGGSAKAGSASISSSTRRR